MCVCVRVCASVYVCMFSSHMYCTAAFVLLEWQHFELWIASEQRVLTQLFQASQSLHGRFDTDLNSVQFECC